jgi:hypothetical protein
MRHVRRLLMVPIAIALVSCAVQRAQVAHEAQDKMIGLRKEQVLACMGVPASKAAEGVTEVWSYNSGNGTFKSGNGAFSPGGNFSST